MKKKQTYQLVKTTKKGTVSDVKTLCELVYCGERVALIEQTSLLEMFNLSRKLTSHVAACELVGLGVDFSDLAANAEAAFFDSVLDVYDVLPAFTPKDEDTFLATDKPKERLFVDSAMTCTVSGRYYRRTKSGDVRYTGIEVTCVTFGKTEKYLFRCNGSGTVSPRMHSLQSLYRLIEKDVTDIAHASAGKLYKAEKKRVDIEYRLAPLYSGSATVTS